MQHYGLPTRLLDWTESPIVAAFFAVCYDAPPSVKDDAAVIWYLNATRMNALRGNHLGIPDLSDLEQSPEFRGIVTGAFGLAKQEAPVKETAVAVLCDEVDVRIAVQRGAFTIHNSEMPLEQSSVSHEYLIRLEIPALAKAGLAKELEMLGICRMNLFPDLHNLAIDLRHQCVDLGRY